MAVSWARNFGYMHSTTGYGQPSGEEHICQCKECPIRSTGYCLRPSGRGAFSRLSCRCFKDFRILHRDPPNIAGKSPVPAKVYFNITFCSLSTGSQVLPAQNRSRCYVYDTLPRITLDSRGRLHDAAALPNAPVQIRSTLPGLHRRSGTLSRR